MTTTAVVPSERAQAVEAFFTAEQVQLIKRQFLRPRDREPTDDELALFVYQCERAKLDPFTRQIYAVYRWDSRIKGERMSVETTIDGFRLVAERTDKYLGQVGAYWLGVENNERKWFDAWVETEPPLAAKVGVWKVGAKEPTFGVATFKEYAQRNRSGELIGLWPTMPANQLAKCAEALALRKAFPRELSGLYTREEMAQADKDEPTELPAVPESAPPRESLDLGGEGAIPPGPRTVPSGIDPQGPIDEPTPDVSPPPPPVAEVRREDAPATTQEINALRELIKVTETAESFVRMALIDYGIDDVGEIDELLPRLTVGQAAHVMLRINERAAG